MYKMSKRKWRKLVEALQSPELKAELDMGAITPPWPDGSKPHYVLLGDASDAIPPQYGGLYDPVPYRKPEPEAE
jgi:hypothetical protein